jgi:sensor histidine kinase YesM
LTIHFRKEVDNPAHEIAPMILLPFIENAFKHGAGEMRFESFVYIHLILQKGILKFSIENSKDGEGLSEITENIGLSNVRRQLQLMYKDYDLKVQDQGKTFRVNLTLNLNKNASL